MAFLDETGLSHFWAKVKAYVAEHAGTATKLETARAIDGVLFDGSAARHHYGTCSTSGSTAAKTCSITGFSLTTGARVTVRFSYANTAANMTLNVSGTGAKAVYYRSARVPAGYIKQYDVIELVYSGSYWYIVGELSQKQIDGLEADVGVIGTVYSANGTVNVTSNVDSYADAAGITLPAGTYMVTAHARFPTNQTATRRNVRIYNSTDSAALQHVSVLSQYYTALEVSAIAEFAKETILQCQASAGTAISSVTGDITAVRIK